MKRLPQQVEEILSHYPEPVLLRQERKYPMRVAIFGAVVAATGFLLAIFGASRPGYDHDPQAWGVVMVPLGLVSVWYFGRDLRRPNELLLRRDGFQLSGSRGEKWYAWADVVNFRVNDYGDDSYRVVFDVLTAPRLRRKRVNFDDRLTDDYGMSHVALAWLMDRWRERASAESSRY